MHHGVKLSYYHSLYKRGGKIFIPHVLWDMNIHPSRIYNKGKGDPFGTWILILKNIIKVWCKAYVGVSSIVGVKVS